MWKRYASKRPASRHGTAASHARRLNQYRPKCEDLEDRSVPSILFSSTGSRSIVDTGGPILQSMQVDLIFWGTHWNDPGANQTLRTNVQNTVTAILNSTYFDGLSQYRLIGHGSLLRSDTITSSSPGSTFQTAANGDLATMVANNINNGTLPSPNGRILYFVVPQPGSTPSDCSGCGGRHLAAFASGNRVFPYGLVSNPTGAAIDSLSWIMSHELAEAATNPEWNITINNVSQAAFHVPNNNGDEIGDGEPNNNGYFYRVNGALVQAYLSQRDHAYIVTNGSTNNFLVSSARVLSFQEFAFGNNDIYIGRVGNGVSAELNLSTAQFEPGSISRITVNALRGDSISIGQTGDDAHVSVFGSGALTVSIGANGSVQGIGGAVTVSNSAGSLTSLSVDDSRDFGTRTAVVSTVTSNTLYESLGILAPATIYSECATTQNVDLSTGPGAVTTNVLATCGHGLNLHGNGPNTAVNIGNAGSLAGIQSAGITVSNANGDTAVVIDDRNDAGTRTATISTTGSSPLYMSLAGLTPAPAGTTIYAQCAASRNVDVYTGTGAVTANVLATCGHGLNLHGNGPNTTVNVGNAGSLAGIQSAGITVSNANGDTAVAIDDRNGGGNRTATIDTIRTDTLYTSLAGLTPTPAGTTIYAQCADSQDVDVYTGTGAVTANVLATCGHGVNLHGGSGTNTLVGPITPTGFNITGINAGTLTGGVNASFSNFQNLTGGSGGEAFIFADGAGVDGSIGNNNGAASTLDYSAYSTPVAVDLSANSATGVGGSVTGIVTLRGGTSDDSLTGNAAGGTIFVASPGNDTLTGLGAGNSLYNADANGTADSTWSVTAQNSGTLSSVDGTTTFSGMQNLTGGGTGAATFILADGTGVDGAIQGSGGANALDYTAYTGDVYVNLQEGIATGVGAVMNIQTVIGGQGSNILVGDGNENLTGGPGQNLLISGGGSGQLTGGGAGDILIGGATAYDTDDASLQAILSYWTTSGDDYPTRVANLRAGNGVPQLEGGITVFDNGAANTITGNGSEDQGLFNLFYVTEAGTVTDQQPDEMVVDIDNPAGMAPAADHGGSRNLSRESLSAAAAADCYFLHYGNEMNGMNLLAKPAHGGQTAATARVHPVVWPAEGTTAALDLFAPW